MEDRQRPGQNDHLRSQALPDEDEGGHRLAALGRRLASTKKPGLAVSRRLVYPPSGLLPTADSDSVPVQTRAIADVPTLTEDKNPFGHLQPSMGRLSLQSSEGVMGRMAKRGGSASTSTPAHERHVNLNFRAAEPPPGWSPSKHSTLKSSPFKPYSKEFSQSWENEIPSPFLFNRDEERRARRTASYEKPKREDSREQRTREENRERIKQRKIHEEESMKDLEFIRQQKPVTRERERVRRWQEAEEQARAKSKPYLEHFDSSDEEQWLRRNRAKKSPSPKSTDRESAATYDGHSSTGGVNTTISRDSSADESVRQARLLAAMGKRSQMTRNGSDVGSTSAEPRTSILVEDTDEDGYSTSQTT